MKTVILGAGLGTQIGEETHLHPKPMIEIGGRAILRNLMKTCSSFFFPHSAVVTFDLTKTETITDSRKM